MNLNYQPIGKRRKYTARERETVFMRENGICHLCNGVITPGQVWHMSHDQDRELNGTDDLVNIFPAHEKCHQAHTAAQAPIQAKVRRQRQKHMGIKRIPARPIPGSKASGWKRPFNRPPEPR